MQYTQNLNLRKPEYSDNIDIEDLNANADVLDEKIHSIESVPTYAAIQAKLASTDPEKYPVEHVLTAGDTYPLKIMCMDTSQTGMLVYVPDCLERYDPGTGVYQLDFAMQASRFGDEQHDFACRDTSGILVTPTNTTINDLRLVGASIGANLFKKIQMLGDNRSQGYSYPGRVIGGAAFLMRVWNSSGIERALIIINEAGGSSDLFGEIYTHAESTGAMVGEYQTILDFDRAKYTTYDEMLNMVDSEKKELGLWELGISAARDLWKPPTGDATKYDSDWLRGSIYMIV